MQQTPRTRRRPALSCIECRRRKIKCDRKDPCAHCLAVKAQCVHRAYHEPLAPQHPPQNISLPVLSATSTLTSPSPVREAIEPVVTTQQNRSSGLINPALTTHQSFLDRPPQQNRPQDAESDVEQLIHRVQRLEQASATSPLGGLAETGRDILEKQAGLKDSQIVLNKTRILRWSHWMGTAQEFALVYACHAAATGQDDGVTFQSPESRSLAVEVDGLMRKCKDVARSIKTGQSETSTPYSELRLSSQYRGHSDVAASAYFKSFESVHRILHAPSFWADYRRFWDEPESCPNSLRLKVLLVLGIGSALAEYTENNALTRSMVRRWIHAAQTWLSGPMKKDRLDIAGLQIYCLTILARQVFSVGGDLVWISVGSLVHRAMQIGLHRDPKYLPGMSVLQAQLRRRLWATIIEMALQSSLDSAMPPRISLDEFDSEPPSNINDDDMDEFTTTLPLHRKETYTETSLQLLLLDSLPIRLKILRLLNSLHSELSYLDVLALGSEINEADRACNKFLNEHQTSDVGPFQRNMLYYYLRRFILPLHCPFACKARENPLFYYSLKASLDTAMSIISPEPDEGFSRVLILGGGLFREGIRVATSAICQELIAQAEAHQLDGTLHRKSQYRELLKKAIEGMMALAIERIRQGETNIKMHMLLSMILAQAEAIEMGTDRELMVARSAKDSLVFCHGLLCTLAGDALRFDHTPEGFAGGEENLGLDLDFDYFFASGDFL